MALASSLDATRESPSTQQSRPRCCPRFPGVMASGSVRVKLGKMMSVDTDGAAVWVTGVTGRKSGKEASPRDWVDKALRRMGRRNDSTAPII